MKDGISIDELIQIAFSKKGEISQVTNAYLKWKSLLIIVMLVSYSIVTIGIILFGIFALTSL